jgi:predicted PurR-regulated permease PerM
MTNPAAQQDPPARRVRLVQVWWLLLAAVLLWLFWRTYTVWFAAFLAISFTATLSGLAGWARDQTGVGYRTALGIIVALLVAAAVGVGLWVGPSLIAQSDELTRQLPEAWDQTRGWLEQRDWGEALLRLPDRLGGQLGGSQLLDRATWLVSSTVGALGGILAVIAITLFMAVQPSLYIDGAVKLVRKDDEGEAREVLSKIGTALRWWMAGRLASMLIVGLFTGLGLWLVGVPLPWVLGLIAGVLSFVPNLGPLLSTVPGLLLAGTVSGTTVVWALAVYVGVQLIESNLITPMVQRFVVSVPPALLLTVQLMMGVLFGVMGLIVATPLMVAVIVAVQVLYVRDRLGREVGVMGQ